MSPDNAEGAPLLGGWGMPSPSRKPMISSMYFMFVLPFVRWFRHLGDGWRTAPSTPGTNKFRGSRGVSLSRPAA